MTTENCYEWAINDLKSVNRIKNFKHNYCIRSDVVRVQGIDFNFTLDGVVFNFTVDLKLS